MDFNKFIKPLKDKNFKIGSPYGLIFPSFILKIKDKRIYLPLDYTEFLKFLNNKQPKTINELDNLESEFMKLHFNENKTVKIYKRFFENEIKKIEFINITNFLKDNNLKKNKINFKNKKYTTLQFIDFLLEKNIKENKLEIDLKNQKYYLMLPVIDEDIENLTNNLKSLKLQIEQNKKKIKDNLKSSDTVNVNTKIDIKRS